MKLSRHTFQILRFLLDISLIAVVLVIVISRTLPAQANQPTPGQFDTSPTSNFELTAPVDLSMANSAPTGIDLDNNTLAAIIAAENAALNPPQFLLDLPLIAR